MPNELLLILSLILTFSAVIAVFYIFQEQGLYLWTIIATIAANPIYYRQFSRKDEPPTHSCPSSSF